MTLEDEPPSVALAAGVPVTTEQQWLARLAYLAAFGALVAVLAGGRSSIAVLAVGILGIALALAAVWWFLSNRGLVRWVAATLAVAAPVAVMVFYIARERLWYVVVALLFAAVASASARAAMARSKRSTGMREMATPPPARPYLIMNPRSGGGKVGLFGLDTKAVDMGAEVALLAGPDHIDVAELARKAAVDGADLLGLLAATGPRRWSPASPPSMGSPSWSSLRARATISPWTWAWTANIPTLVWTP